MAEINFDSGKTSGKIVVNLILWCILFSTINSRVCRIYIIFFSFSVINIEQISHLHIDN